MSTHLADRYNQAWLFAARAHRNQALSGSPLPYLVHLGMVANELLAADRDGAIERLGETLQIAVLHDTLEDTATSPEELRQQFGEFVCAGVQALSKRVGEAPSVPSTTISRRLPRARRSTPWSSCATASPTCSHRRRPGTRTRSRTTTRSRS